MILRALKIPALSVLASLALAACGPGSSSPNTNAPQPDLKAGEPHGEMKFQPAAEPKQETKQPEKQTAQRGSKTEDEQADANEPEVLDPRPVSTERHPLCVASHDPNNKIPGLTCPACYEASFTQPQPKKVKLDLLFVADSSPSIESSRIAIARGIERFLDQLPKDTDYRLAVMAAHSDKSFDQKNKPSSGLAGKLIVAGSEPAVLSGTTSNFVSKLASKVVRMKSDAASDGGELALYSLDKGITGAQLAENQKLGFFRPDAGLAVIFITDENDICSYGVNYKAGEQPKKNVNRYLKTDLTVEEKANQFFCRDAAGQPTITNVSVYNKLLDLKRVPGSSNNASQPLLISGILYTDEATIPKTPPPSEKYPQYYPEKEVAHGILEMIEQNNGEKVDLAKGNFNEGLRQIGEAAALKLEVKTEFTLKEGSDVDNNSLCVLVDGREAPQVNNFTNRISGSSFLFSKEMRAVHMRGIGNRNETGEPSKIKVFYCEPPSVIDADPERFVESLLPTSAEHYRSLPVPKSCNAVRSRIQSGALDNI